MAFGGYTIIRSNIFNASTHDTSNEWELTKTFDTVRKYIKENHSGDVVMVFENDTEYDGYLLYSWFNDPHYGWKRELNKSELDADVQCVRFDQYLIDC